jgi:hypothetical protein
MVVFLRYLAAIALVIASVGHASAMSILEEISVFYTSNSAFTLTDLSFASVSSGNLIAPGNQDPGLVGPSFAQKILFTQLVSLDTTQSYTFSFDGTYKGSLSNIIPSNSPQSFGEFKTSAGNFVVVGATLSAVPLPKSLPLFLLALIGLAAVANMSRSKGASAVEVDNAPAAIAPAH